MQTSAKFWDKVADNYARKPVSNVAAYDQTMARTREYQHAYDHMLELGCGTGTTALRLRDAVAHVTGSDVSAQMIRIAQDKAAAEGAGNVTFVQADAAQAGDTTYDVVTAYYLFHLVRALLLALPLAQLLGKAPALYFLTEAQLHAAIEDAGFRIVETGNYPVTPASHFVVAQKV